MTTTLREPVQRTSTADDHLDLRQQTVLLTGGTGFIGSHMATGLRDLGVKELYVVRRGDYDLTRPADVQRLFREHPADIVIHLAGLVGGILANKLRPADFCYQNLMMGTLVFHEAWRSGAKKFLAAGAGCGYPLHAPSPLREQDFWVGLPQKESAPYSLAKRLLTVQSSAYWQQHGFTSIVAVPGNVYGPADNFHLQDAHVIPALVRKFVEAVDAGTPEVEVWGTGRAARDFVYVEDIVSGIVRAIERLRGSHVINLSSGHETPVRTVVEHLQRISGFQGAIRWDTSRPDGQLHRRLDTTKARELLGWTTRTDLEEGLSRTVTWYRAHQAEARK